MKNFISVLVVLVIISAVIVFGVYSTKKKDAVVTSTFSECVTQGFSVLESYPRRCQDDNGQSFTEYIGNELEKIDSIRLDSPRPNEVISSPLSISGEARGVWFFEADFPIKLLDIEGNVLAQTIATTDGDWMTEEFVSFTANLEFSSETSGSGLLVLERDNPSGLPENDDSLVVPVTWGGENSF